MSLLEFDSLNLCVEHQCRRMRLEGNAIFVGQDFSLLEKPEMGRAYVPTLNSRVTL